MKRLKQMKKQVNFEMLFDFIYLLINSPTIYIIFDIFFK